MKSKNRPKEQKKPKKKKTPKAKEISSTEAEKIRGGLIRIRKPVQSKIDCW